MPGYWMMYNMYALQRNAYKYINRDKRYDPIQHIEYDYLAPDTANEMFDSLTLFENYVGKAYALHFPENEISEKEYGVLGRKLLEEKSPLINDLNIVADGLENAKRPVRINKIQKAYDIFKTMIHFYGIVHLLKYAEKRNEYSLKALVSELASEKLERKAWLNVGSQLIPENVVLELRKDIREGKLKSWDDVHLFYQEEGEQYEDKKMMHAIASLLELEQTTLDTIDLETVAEWIKEVKSTKRWMVESVESSRKKDYTNPFRKMMHDSQDELDEVLGKFEDNEFIKDQKAELLAFNKKMDFIANMICE
jgi:hypothetical protein